MNGGKFDNVNKLLYEFDFGMNENIPESVKCLKCGKILINACQVPCGCRYCRVCVDGLLESGGRVCPGNTDECGESDLSNAHIDYRVQKKIFKIFVKCPEEMCSFECELINMNEHLRACPNKSIKCIFNSLGCDQSNVAASNMNEHLQLASHSHMEMLMGVINNMRNEIDRLIESDVKNKNEINRLKESDERNQTEIEILKRESLLKAERIESLEEEIKLIKEEKMDNLEKEIKKTVAKMDARLSEMRQEWRDALDCNEAVLKETNGRYLTDMDTRMSAAEKWMDKLIDGTFVWAIDNVAQRRQNYEVIWSEYFYGNVQPYKMALEIQLNSITNTGLTIYLLIYSDFKETSQMVITNRCLYSNRQQSKARCVQNDHKAIYNQKAK